MFETNITYIYYYAIKFKYKYLLPNYDIDFNN